MGIISMNLFELDSAISLDFVCSLKKTVLPDFLAESLVKTLDPKAIVEQEVDGGWKKEYRKRFIVIEGSFPKKIGEDFEYKENRMVIDLEDTDPITGRAIPRPIF
jgi:hypothetical protein